MTGYWNVYANLYTRCSEEEVRIIEAAAKARRLGRFGKARAELAALSLETCLLPVVALEKATLETSLDLQQNRVDVLQTTIEHLSTPGSISSLDSVPANLWTLLKLQHIEALSYRHGALKAALQLARESKAQLEALPLNDWTPTDVGIATYYFSIIEWAHLWSGLVNLEDDTILRGVHDNVSCGDVQQHLLSRGHLFPAWILNLNQSDMAKENASARRAFMEQCYTTATASEPDMLCCLDVRLAFANFLFQSGDVESSRHELEEAGKELARNTWILDSDRPWRELRRQQARARATTDLSELFSAATESQVQGDTRQELATLRSIEAVLNSTDNLDRGEDWHRNIIEVRKRHDFIQAQLGNNAPAHYLCSRVMRSRHLVHYDMSDIDQHAELLRNVEQFELSYPECDLPKMQSWLYGGAETAAISLGKTALAKRFNLKKIKAQNGNPAIYGLANGRETHKVFAIVLDWMMQSLLSHEISPGTVRHILGLHKVESISQLDLAHVCEAVSQLDPANVFVTMFGDENPSASDTWEAKFWEYKDWLWHSPSDIPRPSRHDLLGEFLVLRDRQLQVHRIRYLARKQVEMIQASEILDSHKEDWGLDTLQQIIRCSSFALEVRRRLDPAARAASKSALLFAESSLRTSQSSLALFAKAFIDQIITDAQLKDNIVWFEQAFHRQPAAYVGLRMSILLQKAVTLRARYTMFGTCSADSPLEELDRLEEIYVQQRQTKSILRGADNLLARTTFTARGGGLSHYDLALGFCLEAHGLGKLRDMYQTHLRNAIPDFEQTVVPPLLDKDDLDARFVAWAQRKKARSVTESLGAEILIPRKIMALLDQNPKAQELLRQEEVLQAALDAGDDGKEAELRLLRKEMASHEELSRIMSMRNGQSINLPELLALSKELGQDVVVTDFIHIGPQHTGVGHDFYAMTYADGVLVSMEAIMLRATYLRQWSTDYMSSETPFRDSMDHINLLLPLIASTAKNSKPGDTILFCPTTGLTGLPLHAIDVDGQPLIARNKVVYTQSLSIFRLCRISGQLAEKSYTSLAIQALDRVDSTRPQAADMAFVKRIDAAMLEHSSLDKVSLPAAMARAQLIHFYGHASFSRKQPFRSCLHLGGSGERITVEDLFDIPLRNGAHVSLIGCQSAGLSKSENDDSLGLSTALLFGGAASVLSVLWQIAMRNGHDFQEAFYEELLTQLRNRQGNEVHDLAEATQRAVLRMRTDSSGRVRPPWLWAGFILQGCWNTLPLLNV